MCICDDENIRIVGYDYIIEKYMPLFHPELGLKYSVGEVEIDSLKYTSKYISKNRLDRAVLILSKYIQAGIELFIPAVIGEHLITPIVVERREDDYLLCDGMHRIYACMQFNISKVQALIVDDSPLPPPGKYIMLDQVCISDEQRSLTEIFVDFHPEYFTGYSRFFNSISNNVFINSKEEKMADIKITEELIQTAALLPRDVRVSRYAIATHFFICTKNKSGEYGIILYNYDPINWKQLYPYFISHANEYAFESSDFSSMLKEFENIVIKDNMGREKRLQESLIKVQQTVGQEKLKYQRINNMPDEYWIKYSKSKNMWTIYLFEYYQIVGLADSLNVSEFKGTDKLYVPLNNESTTEILEKGTYRGIKVTSDIVHMLSDLSILSEIKSNALSIV